MPVAILLVDALAHAYRLFHAVPRLTSPAGEPTNAIFGMSRLFFEIHERLSPSHGALAFDAGRPAHRLAIAPDYKAQRPPMPDELRSQLPGLRRAAALFGWPCIEREGFEADDVIASVAARFPDCGVGILSGDKDLAQLVGPRVHQILPPRPDAGGFSFRREADVLAKFGVAPGQMADFLALVGDASDNIAGVPGIGPKTAAALLREFGSLQRLLDNLAAVPKAGVRAKLEASRELLARNAALVRLRDDLPPDAWESLDALALRPPDMDGLAAFFDELGMGTLAAKARGEARQRHAQPRLFD